MKKPVGIPKEAPKTTQEAFGRVLDLIEAVAALRVAAQSETHPLQLPKVAVERLVEAHQALLASHRAIEGGLVDPRVGD